APEVVVRELRRGRRLERRDPAALRVHACENGADDTVLAGRVDSLEHEQETARSLGVESLLEHSEALVQRPEQLPPIIFAESERVTRIAVADSRSRPWLHLQRPDHARTFDHARAPGHAGTLQRFYPRSTGRSGPRWSRLKASDGEPKRERASPAG